MKKRLLLVILFTINQITFGQVQPIRKCGTGIPSAEWEAWFSAKVQDFKNKKSHLSGYQMARGRKD